MSKFILLGAFSLLFSFSVFSQVTSKDKGISIEEKLKKFEGTDQLEVSNTRETPLMPYNLDETIENNRAQNETKYVTLGKNVRLKILSKNEIDKADFKKIKQVSYNNNQ